ncbi:hypothetical protein TrRE_jg2679, partial [Triparma retinervis]
LSLPSPYSPTYSPPPAAYDEDVTSSYKPKSSTTAASTSFRGSISGSVKNNKKEKRKRESRIDRFERDREDYEYDKLKQVKYAPLPGEGFGLSTNLSKPYTRLTTKPIPADIRSLPYLRKALSHWEGKHDSDLITYDLYVSELKSIRQDLTVQNLVEGGGFGWELYYKNMRAAMEEGDKEEAGVCRGRLMEMCEKGVGREVDMVCALTLVDGITKPSTLSGALERVSRIREIVGGKTWGKTDLSIETVKWWANGEHRRFFKAYEGEVGLLGYAMDYLVEGFREVCWGGVRKGYRRMKVEVLERWLGLRKGEGRGWIERKGGNVVGEEWVK